MQARQLLLGLLLPLLPSVACVTASPVVRLHPQGADVTWIAGRAVVVSEQNGVRVATAFDHQSGNSIGLRVEIENNSDAPLVVGPEDVTYHRCKDATTCSKAYTVTDPERVLITLDQERAQQEASATNDAAFGTALLFLSLIGDVGEVASGKANSQTGNRTVALGNRMDISAERHENRITRIDELRGLWSTVALRRNTLAPGRGVGGFVYVPIELYTRLLRVRIKVGGRAFTVLFEQQVHGPYARPPSPGDEGPASRGQFASAADRPRHPQEGPR